MIQETIVTTVNASGVAHIAPMGIHVEEESFIILPFKPSATLNNVLQTGVATLNYCDDVRIFSLRRRNWPWIWFGLRFRRWPNAVMDSPSTKCAVNMSRSSSFRQSRS